MTDADHECPKDGCDYTGFENSVAAHYSGSKDHDGGYERAKILMADQEQAGGSSTETTQEGHGSDPVKETPDGPQGTAQGNTTDPECPECGGADWFDASEHYPEFDYGCPECSTEDNWVVWADE